MKRIINSLYCLLILTSLLIFSCDNTEDDDENSPLPPASVIIENASSFDIAEIYAVLTTEPGWGDNYITSGVLSPGKTLTIVVPPGYYKMRAVTTDPKKYTDTTKNLRSGKIYIMVIYNTFKYRSIENESEINIDDMNITCEFEDNIE